jgi:hypothetical protein
MNVPRALSSRRMFFLICFFFSVFPAHSLTIQFYSSVSKGTAAPADCMEQAKVIWPYLKEFNAPLDWTWVIVCDEAAWRQVEAKTGQSFPQGRILGLTAIEGKLTYIRGNDVTHPFNSDPEFQPRHTIAHEIGHILQRTTSESKAEHMANRLLGIKPAATQSTAN